MFLCSNNFCRATFLCLLALLLITSEAKSFDKKTSAALSHYIMGVMYEDLGDVDSAIGEYQKASKADIEASVIHVNLASSFIKKNDIPKATEELKIAVSLDPEAVEPHAVLALVYSSQDKQDLAVSEYETALKNASRLQPGNIDIYKSLGVIYLQQKKLQEARNTYRLITELAPDDAQAHFYLGNVYNELKQIDLADKEIRRALELKPDYHEALNFLGYTYVERNRNLDEAGIMIRKALEYEPDNGAYIDSLGWLYFKKGKVSEALEHLEKASRLLEDPVIYDHLGDAYLKTGDKANARLNWDKALKLDPKQESVRKKIEGLK
jgi:tetratricopeptide (TPR) repeat protein